MPASFSAFVESCLAGCPPLRPEQADRLAAVYRRGAPTPGPPLPADPVAPSRERQRKRLKARRAGAGRRAGV
jgi:hypothetical protein